MRDSDWSRPNFLRSDWLGLLGASMTTSRTMTTMWTRFVKEVKPSPDHEMVKFVC